MRVKLNGKYTKELIDLFKAAFEQPNVNIFMSFCDEHMLTSDDVINLIEISYGTKFLENISNVNA